MKNRSLPFVLPLALAASLLWMGWVGLRPPTAVYAAPTDIRLNELMASNTTTLADEDGTYSDWIELYNAGADPVSLAGWYLTDNAANLTKWQFPAVTLNPNEYLVVFASSKNRRVAGSELHTNFALSASGEYLGLVLPDGVTIIDEYAPTFPALANDQAYGVVVPGVRDFLTTPTPGASNQTAVPLVAISVPSTVYTAPFTVELSSPYLLPGDQIRYTTNGSEPTAASTLYTAPINITASTRLRARIVRSGNLGPTSHTVYIRLDNAIATTNSTLPLVVVESFKVEMSTAVVPRQVAIAVIPVGTGPLADRAQIIDNPEHIGLAGMRIRGSSSGGFPKKQYKVELWNDYLSTQALNQTVNVSLLGMPAEADWILYAPGRYDRNMMANNFAHRVAQEMGMWGSRTQYVELYLNDNSNSNTNLVDASDYDGIYVLMENIKVDKNRVNIHKLDASQTSEPAITGGYIWAIDRWDYYQHDFLVQSLAYGGEPFPRNQPSVGTNSAYWTNIIYPKDDYLDSNPPPQRDCSLVGGNLNPEQCTYLVNYIEEFGSVIMGGSAIAHDPINGYHKYIDVDSWIDGYILDLFVKDPDALRLSHYFSKPRYGKLYNDLAWDYDRTMGSTDGRDINPCGNISYMPTFNPTTNNSAWFDIWEQLFEDIDFYVRFADRWYDLRQNGPMNTDYMFPLIDGFAAQITPEIYAREIARWDTPDNANYGPRNSSPAGCAPGFGQTINSYDLEVEFFKWWLNRRIDWLSDTHLNLHPPAVSVVGSTAVITRAPSAPLAATLYYTLDGSDPRLPGGGLSPNAIAYSGPAPLTQSTWVYARTHDPAQANQDRRWSALGKVYYQASPPADFTNLVISEIQYNPADDPDNDFEYLELTNIGPVRIDLTGVQIRTAISHTFGVGYLDPSETIVVAKDFNAFQYRYDTHASPWYYANIRYEQWASGSLANGGELIELFSADNSPILAFAYGNSGAWASRANGRGSALELSDLTAVPTTTLADKNSYLANGRNWQPTSEYHGSPGRAGLGPDGRVLFNELLTHTDLPQTDAIELFNTTADPINISHWFLSDSQNNYQKFQIYNGTTLSAGGFIAFDETDFNSGGPNNPFPFALSSSVGETVYLLEADSGGNLLRFVDEVTFGPTANSVSIGRYPDGQGDFVRLCALTLAAPNAPYCYGPIVINEIMYNPAGPDANLEYIELHNTGLDFQSLANWQLRGEVAYDFGLGEAIAPDQYLLLVGFDPNDTALRNAFLTTYDLTLGSVTLIGPWTGGQLSNGGARLTLLRPDTWQALPAPGFYPMLVEDEVIYDDENGWPTEPDGNGPSLELRRATLDNRLPSSWMASDAPNGTPGRHNDDDNPYIHSGANFLVTEGDSGTSPATFTVTLNYRSGLTVTVDYTTQNGTAVAGTDYVATSGTLIFPPQTTSQTITVPIIGNERYEAPRSFNVVLSNPVKGRMGTAVTTITIVDNDPLPTLTLADFSVAEGVGTAVLTATLSHPSAFPVTVNYATADGTATSGADYTPTNGTLTFPADTTSQPILVAIVDDNLDEPDETVLIHLSGITNGVLGNSQAVLTILDNDDPPVISAAPLTVTEGLSGTWMLALSHPSAFTITLETTTADGTALAGLDYEPISGTLTFAPLQTTAATAPLVTLANNVQDGDKTLTLELANPTHATLGQASVGALIVDDEGDPVLTAADQFVVEGAEGETTYAPITLTLSHASLLTTSVAYATADGTAVGGLDYTPISGTVTFAPLQTTAVISVPVLGNDLADPHRTLTVTLSAPVGLELATTAVHLTILDDDGTSTLAVSDVTVNEGDGHAIFHFLLVPASGQTVQVDVATADGTATAGADYTPISTTLSFAPGQTTAELHVPITDDALYEFDETFFLLLSNPRHAELIAPLATATIVDNDPMPSISLLGGDVAVLEGETVWLTVTLSAPSGITATVAYATAEGTAVPGEDYQPLSGTLTFAPLQTVQQVAITTLADGLYEPAETFALLLSDPTHAVLATAEATITLLSEEPPPTVNVAGGVVVDGEPFATFTVSLTAPVGFTITVDYATADGSAVAGVDYVPISGTLAFAPSQTSQQVLVPLLAPPTHRPRRAGMGGKSFQLVLSNWGELEPGQTTAETEIVEPEATGYALFLPLITR